MNDPDRGSATAMHLQVLLPTEVLVDEDVIKIVAEAENGEFCLLPRHIDFAAALVPGVLCFCGRDGEEKFAGIDEGVLVKCARDVMVSTSNGVLGTDLRELRALIEERFIELNDHERKVRTALARLEAGTLRRFRQLEETFYG